MHIITNDAEKFHELGCKVARSNGFRLWSKEELNKLEILYGNGTSHKIIAEELSRSENSIRSKVSKLYFSYSGLRQHKFTVGQDRYIKQHYGFVSVSEISEHLGLSYNSVVDRATKRLKLKKRYCGENNHSTIFSDDDIELIRSLGDEGLCAKEIADKFESSANYIRKILSFRARTDLTIGNWKSDKANNYLRSKRDK